MGRRISPFCHYRIITEDVLTPEKRTSYICELANRGWIHPEFSRPIRRSPHREFTFVEIYCSPEHLGKVCAYMLDKEGWIIIEKDE